MSSLFPGLTCSAPFQSLTRLVHLRKWANHSWLFQAASLWACSSRNTCQAIFPSPANALPCLICGLCWKTVVSGSTSAPVRLFSLKPSAEDVPHNAFGTHRSQGGKRLEIQFPSFLFINPCSHWWNHDFWFIWKAEKHSEWEMQGMLSPFVPHPQPFFFVVFFPSLIHANVCKE